MVLINSRSQLCNVRCSAFAAVHLRKCATESASGKSLFVFLQSVLENTLHKRLRFLSLSSHGSKLKKNVLQ